MTDTDSPPEPPELAHLEPQRSHDKPVAEEHKPWTKKQYDSMQKAAHERGMHLITTYRKGLKNIKVGFLPATDVRSESPHGTKDEVNGS